MTTGRSTFEISDGPSAWYARDLQKPEEWLHHLTEADVEEIDEQVGFWSGVPLAHIQPGYRPLRGLGDRLRELGRELDDGRGFFLIRGVPVERYTEEQASIAFWVMGSALGRPVSQNARGQLLGHVRDTGEKLKQPEARGYHTNERLAYHTDHSDAVGLLCLKTAKSGGLSTLSSAVTVHNELLRRRPDLVPLLHKPFAFDYRGEQPETWQRPYYLSPAYTVHDGRLSTYMSRSAIYAAQRFDGVAPLTAEQDEALTLMQQIAHEDGIRLDMEFHPGDIQVLSNYTILHSRTSYEDHDDPELKRHLLRLWLRTPTARDLPHQFGIGTRGTIADGGIIPQQITA
ncbi:hypothetical protein JOF56_009641 [Kibdelosporangium banguiense]|uniref:TauD/TfdA-like domain-containing protein n=1 Tax=Kibdelosporangium banguiense TaxID=1365924 RepID=A0ABS4TY08_9PSEU|nr:TauD/TfdA family dioxygenase [Kibdelosporangium banguiense]MBP2329256.1 hypothetical protein [Kibdelosporangium banguiense]